MMIEMQQGSFFDQYEVYEEIGSGHFAVVRRCMEKSSGAEYAAKIIRKRRTSGSRRGAPLEDIHREIELLKEMNHQNVISLHSVYDTGLEVVLVLELVQGGELFEYISEKDCLSEEETGYFVAQILMGLEHMHSKGIAHLDLKPENVLLVSKESRWIKLIDFGLSRRMTTGDDVHELLGTPEFVAPEIVNFEPVSLATDMWSVGVITYMLLSGASPFLGDTKQETFANVSAVDYCFDEEYFENVSEAAIDFISQLLVRDPRKRATVHQCLCHPWLQQTAKVVFHTVKLASSAKAHDSYIHAIGNGAGKHTVNSLEQTSKKNHLKVGKNRFSGVGLSN